MNNFFILVSVWLYLQKEVAPKSQLGFAHRVNHKANIKGTLDNGAMAFELDICHRTADTQTRGSKWYVSHGEYPRGECSRHRDELSSWLGELKRVLDLKNSTGSYIYRDKMSAIWLDIKDRKSAAVDIPGIVHAANLPHDLQVFYDLVWFDQDSKNVFDRIRHRLTANEGIMFCRGGNCQGTPEDIYKFYCKKKFTKGLISTGDLSKRANNVDLVTAANIYKCPGDPGGCGFKGVFGWTISTKADMKKLVNPANAYSADGLIYGGDYDWNPNLHDQHGGLASKFIEAVDLYPSAHLPAVSVDLLFTNRPLAAIKKCTGQHLAGYTSNGRSEYTRDQAYKLCMDSADCSGITRSHGTGLWTLRAGTECQAAAHQDEISYLIGKRCPNKFLQGYTGCSLGRKKVFRCVAYQQCLDCDECSGISQVGSCDECWTLRKGTVCKNSLAVGTSIQLRGF